MASGATFARPTIENAPIKKGGCLVVQKYSLLMRRHDERYEQDQTPSRTVVESCRKAFGQDDADASLALVQYRGGREELEIGLAYARSDDPKDRAVGADVLGQLGWSDCEFLDETVGQLIEMLADSDAYVVYCAAVGLGHRADERAIPHLVRVADHPDPKARYGVAVGLCGHDNLVAIACLIKLASDPDRDVRSWAVFGLGTLIDTDTNDLREALFRATTDTDLEVRGEALVGLARRHDPRTKDALLLEWQGDDIGILSLEAVQELHDSSLLPILTEIHEGLAYGGDDYFEQAMLDAMDACKQATNQD